LAAASGRRWPICWCCLDRGPGSFDVQDATTLSWSSAAVSEWVQQPHPPSMPSSSSPAECQEQSKLCISLSLEMKKYCKLKYSRCGLHDGFQTLNTRDQRGIYNLPVIPRFVSAKLRHCPQAFLFVLVHAQTCPVAIRALSALSRYDRRVPA